VGIKGEWRHGDDITYIDGGKIYTDTITAEQIAAGTITASKINMADFINLPSDENLVGYWSFDEGSGALAVDGSGHGNNGTLVDMAEEDWVDGVVGKALDFAGDDDYVEIPDDESLDILDGFTIAFWTKYSLGQGGGVDRRDGAGEGYFLLFQDTGKIAICLNDGINQVFRVNIGAGYNDGEWYHGVFTGSLSSGVAKVYVDSEQVGLDIDISSITGTITPDKALNIGRSTAIWFTIGLMDEVRIYKRGLTEAEIKA
ncbi:unnamed protein product, partial [marine sediment metagenome]